MRVFLKPTGMHSPAMKRVEKALMSFAPSGVQVVDDIRSADLVALHVHNCTQMADATIARVRGQRYAVIQYCWRSAGHAPMTEWRQFWGDAHLVWSYYRLPIEHSRFMCAPLGVDDEFMRAPRAAPMRRRLVVTTGHVNGYGAEAIEEVWAAADRADIEAVHVGPAKVEGLVTPRAWRSMSGITDEELATLYRSASWVSGLRYVEGFELPAAEGLACGARPLLFDQDSQRGWYTNLCDYYFPETSGQDLIDQLVGIFNQGARRVTEEEHSRIAARFNWQLIAELFWTAALTEVAA